MIKIYTDQRNSKISLSVYSLEFSIIINLKNIIEKNIKEYPRKSELYLKIYVYRNYMQFTVKGNLLYYRI